MGREVVPMQRLQRKAQNDLHLKISCKNKDVFDISAKGVVYTDKISWKSVLLSLIHLDVVYE